MRHLWRGLHQGWIIVCIVNRYSHGHTIVVVQPYWLSTAIDLVTLHHQSKFFINLVVFSLSAGSERILVLTVWGVWRLEAIFVFLFVKSLDNIIIGPGLVRLIILGVLEEDLVHVRGGILE